MIWLAVILRCERVRASKDDGITTTSFEARRKCGVLSE